MPPVILTRRELYDLVWSKPLRDVATDLGISDVGLAKVCTRHRVPRPEQGYWNKINAGKPTRKSVFVDIDDNNLNRVEINGAFSRLPEEVRVQIEVSRARRRAKAEAGAPRLMTPPVMESPAQIHQSAEPTVRALRKAKPDVVGTVRVSGAGLCNVEIAETSVERVATLLDSLARHLDAKGLPLRLTETGVDIPRGSEAVTFALKEKTRRQKHIATAEELEAEAKREKRRQQYWSGARRDIDHVSLFDRAYPEFDTVQTGALTFEVAGYDSGMRHSWADGKVQTVETLIESVVIGIDAILTFRRVEREQREDRERKWNELCRRRDLVKKRKEREGQRLLYWKKIARTQREIEMLHHWVARNQLNDSTSSENVHRMVGWVRARLTMLEDSVSMANVDQTLANKNLFPEIDDLVDPLGDPPSEPRYAWQL